MKKKLAVALSAVLVASAILAGCGNKNSGGEDKAKTDEFIVGFDQNFPPMGFVGDDGEYTGFDLELAKEVADRLDMKFVEKPIEWDVKDAELEAGGITCIWNGFTMQGREDAYAWTDPYLDNEQVFVVKADSGISSAKDLEGKIVDVQTESSAQAALEENTELSNTFTMQVVPDYNTGLMELESGAVDAVAMDSVVAAYQIQKRGDGFKILDDVIATEEYGVAFKKGNEELRDKVQDTLVEMAKDGTMGKISEKWFGEDITIIGK